MVNPPRVQSSQHITDGMSDALDAPSGVIISAVAPVIDGGRYPVKREVGDALLVEADIFREGHDRLSAVLQFRREADPAWQETAMSPGVNDRWQASFPLDENSRFVYRILAYPDRFGTLAHDLEIKLAAGVEIESDTLEAEQLVRATQESHSDAALHDALERLAVAASPRGRAEVLLETQVLEAMDRLQTRSGATVSDNYVVVVDRVRARFASWYELFPRSAGTVEGQGGTFADVIDRLDDIADLGFDVLYFPPIHPIGKVNRKGPNNTLVAGPTDPGCPYAIGSAEGGHDAIHPDLGTLEDFHTLVEEAGARGLELALDLAIQAAPDHPWASEHPEWFFIRPDGTIKYAENPPKKYEDIYPVNFFSEDWQALYQEIRRIVLYWVDQGVTHFRVDNPHTKPVAFWEWLINEVHSQHPEVVFLSEAFTRPKIMQTLAKAGFSQSYTYFTWRNFKQELIDYFTELTTPPVSEYMRGNLFPTTPDILPQFLQQGGRAAFRIRAVLAATLSSLYGVYSGFELCEARGIPGREEFLNSEKYQFKVWDWNRPGNIREEIRILNHARRDHPALQEYDNLRFYWSESDHILVYGKSLPEIDDHMLVVVNLDPWQTHETTIHFLPEDFGFSPTDQIVARDLLAGDTYMWTGGSQYVRLDPDVQTAHLLHLTRWQQIDYVDGSG